MFTRRFQAPLAMLFLTLFFCVLCQAGAAAGQSGQGSEQASGQDAADLKEMLHAFLASSDTRQAHETFWAEELVYTSSNGTRFGKADILKGFDGSSEEGSDGPAMVYTGEEVRIQLYGATAVVTFKLVGTPNDGSPVKNYFNTGTFLKRNGEWKAVAWQATMIPVND